MPVIDGWVLALMEWKFLFTESQNLYTDAPQAWTTAKPEPAPRNSQNMIETTKVILLHISIILQI